MSERYRRRVAKTPGAIYGVVRARKRYRCDGHMASERHWIEAGDLYVASALPPDHPEINNAGWWHHRFCAECAPADEIACSCPTDAEIRAAIHHSHQQLTGGTSND